MSADESDQNALAVVTFANQVCQRLRHVAHKLSQEPGAIKIFCGQLGSELTAISNRLGDLGQRQAESLTTNSQLFKVLAALERLCQQVREPATADSRRIECTKQIRQ